MRPVAVFSIGEGTVYAGFAGDPAPQLELPVPQDVKDRKQWRVLFSKALRGLLLSPEETVAVVVEPPLFLLPAKQAVAESLLFLLRFESVGFLQRSVCVLAGDKRSAGVLIDAKEELVVPVFDFRELSPLIRPLVPEHSQTEVIDHVVKSAAIDIRSDLLNNVVETNELAAFQGASALASRRTVWPQLTRERLNGKLVWDSLYDVR